jgi:hypothetical protein
VLPGRLRLLLLPCGRLPLLLLLLAQLPGRHLVPELPQRGRALLQLHACAGTELLPWGGWLRGGIFCLFALDCWCACFAKQPSCLLLVVLHNTTLRM